MHSSSSSSLSFQDAISSAFDSAWQYANTFEPYRQFYQENESLDLDAIRHQEHGNININYAVLYFGVPIGRLIRRKLSFV